MQELNEAIKRTDKLIYDAFSDNDQEVCDWVKIKNKLQELLASNTQEGKPEELFNSINQIKDILKNGKYYDAIKLARNKNPILGLIGAKKLVDRIKEGVI